MRLPMARMELDEVTALRWLNARAAGQGLTQQSTRADVAAALEWLAMAAPPPLAMWLRWVMVMLPQFFILAGDELDEPDVLHRLADHAEDAAAALLALTCSARFPPAEVAMVTCPSMGRAAMQWRRIAELWEAVEHLRAELPRAETAEDVQRLVRRVIEDCPSATAGVDRMSLDLFEVKR